MAENPIKESDTGDAAKGEDRGSPAESSSSGHDATRRGLIKAGLIAAPVILTLKANSALAKTDERNRGSGWSPRSGQ